MANKNVLEVLEEIKQNDIPFLPEEARDGFITVLKFFMLGS